MRPTHRTEVTLPAVQFTESLDNISASSVPLSLHARQHHSSNDQDRFQQLPHREQRQHRQQQQRLPLPFDAEDSSVSSERRRPIVALIPSRQHLQHSGYSVDAESSDSAEECSSKWRDIDEVEFPPDYRTAPVERAVTSIQSRLENNNWPQLVSFPKYGTMQGDRVCDDNDGDDGDDDDDNGGMYQNGTASTLDLYVALCLQCW